MPEAKCTEECSLVSSMVMNLFLLFATSVSFLYFLAYGLTNGVFVVLLQAPNFILIKYLSYFLRFPLKFSIKLDKLVS